MPVFEVFGMERSDSFAKLDLLKAFDRITSAGKFSMDHWSNVFVAAINFRLFDLILYAVWLLTKGR